MTILIDNTGLTLQQVTGAMDAINRIAQSIERRLKLTGHTQLHLKIDGVVMTGTNPHEPRFQFYLTSPITLVTLEQSKSTASSILSEQDMYFVEEKDGSFKTSRGAVLKSEQVVRHAVRWFRRALHQANRQ